MNETIDNGFAALLAELNKVVASAGEPVEGNIFYNHHDPAFPNANVAHHFRTKRANLLAATLGRGRLLEIGTNAGHSALWMLHHNKTLHYTGVDICQHRYVAPAVEFLKQKFPGRVDFYAGDSLRVLPEILEKKLPKAFDIVHIDGLHTSHQVMQDFQFSKKLCARFAWMIFDDTDMRNIAEIYRQLINENQILPKHPDGWIANLHHEIAMLPN